MYPLRIASSALATLFASISLISAFSTTFMSSSRALVSRSTVLLFLRMISRSSIVSRAEVSWTTMNSAWFRTRLIPRLNTTIPVARWGATTCTPSTSGLTRDNTNKIICTICAHKNMGHREFGGPYGFL